MRRAIGLSSILSTTMLVLGLVACSTTDSGLTAKRDASPDTKTSSTGFGGSSGTVSTGGVKGTGGALAAGGAVGFGGRYSSSRLHYWE